MTRSEDTSRARIIIKLNGNLMVLVVTQTYLALKEIEPEAFQSLAVDVLRATDYPKISPTTRRGADGGLDAIIDTENRTIGVHISVNKEWKDKLFKDFDKLDDHDREYDIGVFVTNQDPGGKRVQVMEEVNEKYEFGFDLWDLPRLASALQTNLTHLIDQHFGFNPTGGTDIRKRMDDFVENRVNALSKNDGRLPVDILDRPLFAAHLLPVDSLDGDTGCRADELSPPPLLSHRPTSFSHQARGETMTTFFKVSEQGASLYTSIDEQGWIEAVCADYFTDLDGNIDGKLPSIKFEKDLFSMLDICLGRFESLDMNPPIYIYLSVINAKGCSMSAGNGIGINRGGVREFRTNRYTTKRESIADIDADPVVALKPSLDRLWREAGWQNGSRNYDDEGNWSAR